MMMTPDGFMFYAEVINEGVDQYVLIGIHDSDKDEEFEDWEDESENNEE